MWLQSRVGPVEWLKPYTDVTIRELGKRGVKSLLAVPVRFVFWFCTILSTLGLSYMNVNIMKCYTIVALLPLHYDELCPGVVYILGKVNFLI